MSNSRATIRTAVQRIIDPATTEYTAAELNNWINEALNTISYTLFFKYRTTDASFTGQTITISRPVTLIDYVLIDGSYWQPLAQSHHGYNTGSPSQAHFDIRPDTNDTLILLSAAQTAVSYTISYYAPIDILTDDTTTIIPDGYLHLINLYLAAAAYRHQLADEIAASTNTDRITHLKSAVDQGYGRFYDALQIAQAVQGI